MQSSPAYSPCEPAFGCSDTASKPVIAQSMRSSPVQSARYPSAWSAGTKGCSAANPGKVTGIISAVALSFMVQEPSGIIERSRATSFAASCRR